MGLFGGMSDRGEMLELQSRVARLEEQVARLISELGTAPASAGIGVDSGPGTPVAPPAVYAEARALAASGRKINAIKVVRDQSGMSLKAAKDLVESW